MSTTNRTTNDPNVTINDDQRLYVIQSGKWVSCLGFDVAFKRAAGYAAWTNDDAPDPAKIGTPDGWDDYARCLHAASEHARVTNSRCSSELEPRLIGLEGKRIEVITPDGERSRFIVGKSTGWAPIHLEIKTRRSTGGAAAYVPDGATIRVIA